MKIEVSLSAALTNTFEVDVDISKALFPKKKDVVDYLQQNAKHAMQWNIQRGIPSAWQVLILFRTRKDAEAFLLTYDPDIRTSEYDEYISPANPANFPGANIK